MTPEEILIMVMIRHSQNEDVRRGLTAALGIVQSAGYYNLTDLENMDEEILLKEALSAGALDEGEF